MIRRTLAFEAIWLIFENKELYCALVKLAVVVILLVVVAVVLDVVLVVDVANRTKIIIFMKIIE